MNRALNIDLYQRLGLFRVCSYLRGILAAVQHGAFQLFSMSDETSAVRSKVAEELAGALRVLQDAPNLGDLGAFDAEAGH